MLFQEQDYIHSFFVCVYLFFPIHVYIKDIFHNIHKIKTVQNPKRNGNTKRI